MHNGPGIEIGKFGICHGPILGSLDEFDLIVTGRGGHAAKPNEAIDPIVIAAQVIVGLQTLISPENQSHGGTHDLHNQTERRHGL